MTKFYKASILMALVLSLFSAIMVTLNMFDKKAVYYVNNGKLYESFQLTKECESKLKQLRIHRKNEADSIGLTVKQLENQGRQAEYEYARDYYLAKLEKFQEEEDGLMSEYNRQIWERLNQYSVEFSKQKNIQLLFGASGDGNLLHADSKLDLTKDLIEFSNIKYAGK